LAVGRKGTTASGLMYWLEWRTPTWSEEAMHQNNQVKSEEEQHPNQMGNIWIIYLMVVSGFKFSLFVGDLQL